MCRASGAGCKVQGAGCRVQGVGCRVWAVRSSVEGFTPLLLTVTVTVPAARVGREHTALVEET